MAVAPSRDAAGRFTGAKHGLGLALFAAGLLLGGLSGIILTPRLCDYGASQDPRIDDLSAQLALDDELARQAGKLNQLEDKLSRQVRILERIELVDIAAAQQMLSFLGFDCGPVDNRLGRKTRAGLRSFQAAYDLPTTGELDHATWESLCLVYRIHRSEDNGDAPPSARSPAPSVDAPDLPDYTAPDGKSG